MSNRQPREDDSAEGARFRNAARIIAYAVAILTALFFVGYVAMMVVLVTRGR